MKHKYTHDHKLVKDLVKFGNQQYNNALKDFVETAEEYEIYEFLLYIRKIANELKK